MPGNLPLSHGNRPLSTITPPIAVPWPQMNFVAECTTMSAPHSSGRHRYGEANVLSTTSGTPFVVRDLRQGLDVDHVDRRVADHLGVERLRLRRHGSLPLVEVGAVDEARIDADLPEAHVELLEAPAVEAPRRDELVAGLHQREQRQVLSRLPGGRRHRSDPVLERGDALLEHRRRSGS